MSTTPGYLSKFQYGNMPTASGSNSWTDFSQILSIKPPAISSKDIDISVMDSPSQFEQFIPGWANGGEVEVKVQFEKSQQATIYGNFRKLLGYRIVFNDAVTTNGSNLAMDGYISKFQNEIDRENLVTADITVKISGKPVFTVAS